MSDELMRLELDSDVTECGDVVTGTARWGPLDFDPRRVIAELRYWTEGRGDQDSNVVSDAAFDAEPEGQGRFELVVPASGPMSFDGSLIRVLWEVRLRFDRSMRSDPSTSAPLTVLPLGGLAMWARQSGAPPQ